jgi:archaeosine-15-forming tRNA-guanine transglycosylase
VLVYGVDGKLLAVGKAVLSGVEMLELERGTAVKVRHKAPSNLKIQHT